MIERKCRVSLMEQLTPDLVMCVTKIRIQITYNKINSKAKFLNFDMNDKFGSVIKRLTKSLKNSFTKNRVCGTVRASANNTNQERKATPVRSGFFVPSLCRAWMNTIPVRGINPQFSWTVVNARHLNFMVFDYNKNQGVNNE